jgi:hypothetical protein
MTTQEMHIEIDLILQKINSQGTKNILPQEKDWFLNNAVIDYLQQKINPSSNVKQLGFEDTAKRVEDIKDLIRVVNKPIQINNRGESFITFPSNYFGYIRFDSRLRKSCTTDNTVPSTGTVYKNTFKIVLSSGILNSFTISILKNAVVTDLFTLTDLPSGYINSSESFDKQGTFIIKALKILLTKKVKEVLSPDTELYWEKEGSTYTPLSFTIVSNTAFTSITTNIVTDTTSNVVTDTSTSLITTYTINQMPLKAKIRVVDDEFLTDIENSSLSKSRANSPVSVVRESCLILSKLQDAIYGSVDITYICMPNLIDLLLNNDLNVSDKVAKEVVKLACTRLKGILESQDYQTYVQENILTE